MTYMIVYSSLTGNTKMLAEAIKNTLGENSCNYCGEVAESMHHEADIVFVGFWVNKGSCNDEIKRYVESLENKRIALFGTAGFGGSKTYFENIVEKVKSNIAKSNIIVGDYMCQGKMTENVLERYYKLLEEKPENSDILNLIQNYNNAILHPDENDIKNAQLFAKRIISNVD